MGTENTVKKKLLSYGELGSFFENMAMMVKAGITTGEAVNILKDETDPAENGILSASLNTMSDKISQGESLEDSMKGLGTFPEYSTDMIGVAEYTGRLEDTLFHLADYYRQEETMRNTIVSAVRYPIILLGLVIAVLAVMLAIVFPAFSGVYSNLTGSLTASSFNYLNISITICWILLAVMIVAVILIIAGVVMWRSGKRDKVQKMLSKFKVFSELFENLDLYRFTSCFDMFISSGEMQEEALKKSMTVVESENLMSKLKRCSDKLDSGKSFSQVAYEEKLYDQINNRMLMPAERSGMLDSILQKILRNLRGNNEKYISRIANTIEPLLTGILMVSIGLMLISLMIPLIGIMNSIG